jgi:HK97 family phage major capsid protein
MMSRTTRTALLNTRDGYDRPILSADLTQLLGVRIVINDYIPFQKCLYGDFRSGVYVRSAAMAVQRMEEAYKEQGAVGFRFIQRSDWGFFSTVANASQAEQPVVLLSPVDAGS